MFSRAKNSGIYKEGEQSVKETIINMTASEVVIMLSLPGGHACHYSKGTKLNGCIPRILASPRIEDDNFTSLLWRNSLGHMAFKNGVWSFDERRLLSFEEALQKQIYFTRDTGRPCPQLTEVTQETVPVTVTTTEAVRDQLITRVIEPFLPDKEQRVFFLNCLARALAGRIAGTDIRLTGTHRLSSRLGRARGSARRGASSGFSALQNQQIYAPCTISCRHP